MLPSSPWLRASGRVTAIVKADPAVDYVSWFSGSWGTSNYMYIPISLKPRKERDPASVVVKRLREALAVVPGVKIDLMANRTINISGGNSKYSTP